MVKLPVRLPRVKLGSGWHGAGGQIERESLTQMWV